MRGAGSVEGGSAGIGRPEAREEGQDPRPVYGRRNGQRKEYYRGRPVEARQRNRLRRDDLLHSQAPRPAGTWELDPSRIVRLGEPKRPGTPDTQGFALKDIREYWEGAQVRR